MSISLTNYLECQPESSFFHLHYAFANVLTYFSSKGVTTIQSLLTRAINWFLGWETLRDQVSAFGTHDPCAVSFAEAAFRHLSTSVVPWKNISGVVLGVFADHSVRHDTISAYGSYVSLSCMQSMEVTAF